MNKDKPEPICNMCGFSCRLTESEEYDIYDNGGLIDAVVVGGYSSTPGNGSGALDDGNSYSFTLCEFCLDWLFSHFTIPVLVKDIMHPKTPGTIFVPAVNRVVNEDWRRFKDEFFEEYVKRNKFRQLVLDNRH